MVSFLGRRLQVFVSSTYSDLRDERQAAVESILNAGHIPAGMELFTAGDESQMDVIKDWIDESDVYMLILGSRYGSIEPMSGKSYTQLEYEYAVGIGKPLFSCVISDRAVDARIGKYGSSVIERERPDLLRSFRDLVLAKMVKMWDDDKDIKIAVQESLSHIARRDDLLGWVRADRQANSAALADEIARLSRENAELRARLAKVEKEASEDFEGVTLEQLKSLLGNRVVDEFLSLNFPALIAPTPSRDDLINHGLVEYDSTFKKWVMTPLGRRLRNRLELERQSSGQ